MRTRRALVCALLIVGASVCIASLAQGANERSSVKIVRGSTKADTLVGTGKADRLYGYSGADRIFARGGADLVIAGPGRDRVWGGQGGDTIVAIDGYKDTIYCGPGHDVVVADRFDAISRDCEVITSKKPKLPPAPTASPAPVNSPAPPTPPSPPATPTSPNGIALNVSVSGPGTVHTAPAGIQCPGDCRGEFAIGEQITLTATPSSGQHFRGWSGRCRGTRTTCSVRLRETGTVRASFGAANETTPPPPSPPPPPGSTPPPAPPPPPSSPSTGSIVRSGSNWTCDGPVNIDLVRVTSPPGDAIVLADGCTGRIGRIEVETWTADGVKIQNQDNPAHDLVIGGGYVKCHAIQGDTHQDAVQAMAGERITFNNVSFDCLGNSNFFVNRAAGSHTPSDIVCDGCTFAGKSSTTVRVNVSVRSGARNSTGCPGRNVREAFYFTDAAQSPVNSGNRTLPSSDPLCAN